MKAVALTLALLATATSACAQSVWNAPSTTPFSTFAAPGGFAAGYIDYPSNTTTWPDDASYATQCPSPLNPGDFQHGALMPSTYRFTINQGDQWSGDAGRVPAIARCELAHGVKQDFGVAVWQAFAERISCFAFTPGRRMFFGQWHATDDVSDTVASSPQLEILLDSATQLRVVYAGSTDGNVTTVATTAYTDAAYQCGTWYRWLWKATFTPDHTSQLTIWRAVGNGAFAQVYTGTGLLMGDDDAVGPYWKFGFYGFDDPASVSVEYYWRALPTATDLSAVASETAWPLPL